MFSAIDAVEEEVVLQDDSEVGAVVLEPHRSEVDAVHEDAALVAAGGRPSRGR